VYQSLHPDPSVRTFTIRNTSFDRSCFSQILEFVHGRDFSALSADTALLFLPLCRLLGNERDSPLCAATLPFCEANIDDCISQFHSYSVDAVRLLDKQTLHSLLDPPSLKIKTEDALLDTLIDLGSNYFEFRRYVEVGLLTTEGVSIFVPQLPFDELTFESWVKIAGRPRAVMITNFVLEGQQLRFNLRF
jgi:hypothetical protein